jgi:hypothetical protein
MMPMPLQLDQFCAVDFHSENHPARLFAHQPTSVLTHRFSVTVHGILLEQFTGGKEK